MTADQLAIVNLMQQILDRARRGDVVALAAVMIAADAIVRAYG
jgi:hypothetical protein